MIVSTLTCCGIFSLLKIVYSSDPYKIYNLESDKVCSQIPKLHTKRISTGPVGLIIRESTYFDNWSGKYSFTCRFEIETGHKSSFPGLFAVIQKLNMRKDPSAEECMDYIKLRPVETDIFSAISGLNLNLKNKMPWRKFCGNLSARRDGVQEYLQSNTLSVAGFVSGAHTMEVEIYIHKSPVLNESLELEIAFTPYMDCSKSTWSEFKDCGMNKCIKKQSFNDGVVNCPFLDCPDEDGCDISIIEQDGLLPGVKVTLTAVASIFCSFFLFIGCIWCCRYFELLCWNPNTLLSQGNPVELSPMRDVAPTAPPLDSSLSKDLPPAYETLFPERCEKMEKVVMKTQNS